MNKILLSVSFGTMLLADTNAIIAGNFTLDKTGKVEKNILIDSKECAYIAEGRYNSYTKNTEIKVTEKICKNGRKKVSGSVYSFEDNKNGIPGNILSPGTKVIIKEK